MNSIETDEKTRLEEIRKHASWTPAEDVLWLLARLDAAEQRAAQAQAKLNALRHELGLKKEPGP